MSSRRPAFEDSGPSTPSSRADPIPSSGGSRSTVRGESVMANQILMDLPRWRRERVSERALAYLEAPGHEVAFPDQDALNALFAGKWRPLDPRWNLVLDSAYHCLQKLPLDDRKPLARALAKPGILHFAAGPKPWEKRCPHKRLFLYYVYLDRTRWRSWRPD